MAVVIADSEFNLTLFAQEQVFRSEVDLGEGFRVAVRASGTEPKMKCYFFGKKKVAAQEDLGAGKRELAGILDELWKWTRVDARKRAEGN